jgi:cell division protein FtsQ
LKWRFGIGFLLIVSVLGFSFCQLHKTGFFNLASVDVLVEDFATQKNYLSPLVADVNRSISVFMGQPLFSLRLESVAKSVEALPWVQEVRVSLRWPAGLRLEIKSRDVFLLLAHKNGSMMPVTENGELLPPISANHVPAVALLQGEVFEKQKEKRAQAIQLIHSIPDVGNFSQKNISEIHYDDKEGFWVHLMGSGLRVNLGQDQMLTKSLRVSQVMNYLDEHQMDARVIDANLSKKVLVRLRKDP